MTDKGGGSWTPWEWGGEADTVRATMPPEAVMAGEGPVDYMTPFSSPVSAQEAREPGIRDRWGTHRAIMGRLGLVHDPGTAQPFEYTPWVDRLVSTPVTVMSAAAVEEALYRGLALLHGMGPRVLASLRVGAEPEGEAAPWLDLGEGVLRLPLPRVGYERPVSAACAEACRPGGAWAMVPLLPNLVELARRLGRERSVDGALVFGRRRDHSPADRGLQRLARSTPRWLRYHGLPAVMADLLSGEFSFSTLATSAYVNVSARQVAVAHAQAAAALWAMVTSEGPEGGPQQVEAVGWPEHAASRGEAWRSGSRIVPLLGPLREALEGLEARRRPLGRGLSLAELIRAWNVEAAAAWIRLSWVLALRPRKDPVLTRESLDLRRGWALVEDKDSPQFREVRPVPLPPGAVRWLGSFIAHGDEVRARLRGTLRVTFDAVRESTIFFAIQDRQARLLSPAVVGEIVYQEGLLDRFPWPFNAARHYWLTRALELGIAPERVEPFLGHLHDPLPWGPFSITPLERSAELYRQLGRVVLQEVGLAA